MKRNTIIYPFIKKISNFNSSYKLCGRRSDLCIEGYPSSANSFTFILFSKLNPELEIAHHSHSLANIKLAFRYGVPAIVLLRHPLDAISSRMTRFEPELDVAVFEYVDFYRFVFSHLDSIIVIDFNEITQNSATCINYVAEKTELLLPYSNLQCLEEEAREYISSWTEKYGKEENISLPRKKRVEQKDLYKSKLDKLDCFKKAVEVYEKVQSSRESVEGAKKNG